MFLEGVSLSQTISTSQENFDKLNGLGPLPGGHPSLHPLASDILWYQVYPTLHGPRQTHLFNWAFKVIAMVWSLTLHDDSNLIDKL